MNRSLAEAALEARKPWTDRKRFTIFATAALMLDDAPALSRVGLRALGTGALSLDPQLVEDFYRISPRAEKFAIIEAIAATRFPPGRFRRLFLDGMRYKPDERERGRLGLALRFHLAAEPRAAKRYRSIIRRLLRSRSSDDRLHALDLLSRLDHAGSDDLAMVATLLESSNEGERMNAVNALTEWTRRPSVSAAVKRFAMSDAVSGVVRRLHKADASEDVRLCARYYVKALRRAKSAPASR